MLNAFDNENVAMLVRLARSAKMLSAEEEAKLATEMKAGGARGQRARDKLVLSYLRLAISVAKKFSKSGLPLEDLIQEGNVGLLQAADKFEIEKGFRFGTYARWWVFQAVKQYAQEKGHDIRVPPSTQKHIVRMNKVVKELSADGHTPTDEEVAAAMQEDVAKVRQLAVYAMKPVSINLPVGKDGEDTAELGDFLADDSSPDAEEVAIANDTTEAVQAALGCLKDRERRVIVRRFDLDGEGQATLEDLSVELGITRERVRQIEVKAKEKMLKASGGKLRGLL